MTIRQLAYLQSLGYTILRFPNELVSRAPESLLRAIAGEAQRLRTNETPA
jgi:very-short-patch-repair endonuclease